MVSLSWLPQTPLLIQLNDVSSWLMWQLLKSCHQCCSNHTKPHCTNHF
jgi:hypothetical protein